MNVTFTILYTRIMNDLRTVSSNDNNKMFLGDDDDTMVGILFIIIIIVLCYLFSYFSN
jgi:hypothetical protein